MVGRTIWRRLARSSAIHRRGLTMRCRRIFEAGWRRWFRAKIEQGQHSLPRGAINLSRQTPTSLLLSAPAPPLRPDTTLLALSSRLGILPSTTVPNLSRFATPDLRPLPSNGHHRRLLPPLPLGLREIKAMKCSLSHPNLLQGGITLAVTSISTPLPPLSSNAPLLPHHTLPPSLLERPLHQRGSIRSLQWSRE